MEAEKMQSLIAKAALKANANKSESNIDKESAMRERLEAEDDDQLLDMDQILLENQNEALANKSQKSTASKHQVLSAAGEREDNLLENSFESEPEDLGTKFDEYYAKKQEQENLSMDFLYSLNSSDEFSINSSTAGSN